MFTAFRIAWGNTFINIKRTLAALGGIGFSILLVFLQLGFLNAAKKEVTLLFEYFNFDLAITSDRYQFLATADPFDRIRLFQAQADPAVDDIFYLNVDGGNWVNPETEISSTALVIGVDEKPAFIQDDDLRDGLKTLVDGRSVLVDRFSHRDYGEVRRGMEGRLNKLDVNVTGTFQLGLFFFSEGSVATNNGNFSRLTGAKADDVTMGLIRLRPGSDPNAVAARLREALPDDVLIVTREQLFDQEQGYFVTVKPIGIMFQSAVFVAFAVGLVILFQVLSTELSNRLNEFATLKAMGFGAPFIYGIGLSQNLIFIVCSFVPAWLAAQGLFILVYELSKLPMEMTPSLIGNVFGLTLAMSVIAGYLALRKVRKADPADLF